ncbi:hypothetical protein F1728_24305 [Gimesia benthica]|uniref:CD-NTase-associated protein 12/Pycsar effector protein TIR domain-containing protein n=1 Tax=Gimesia benthica TaxID=2608982 RepID=A0A6I6AG75_9PLAN|nr:hypothetical protein [Gimesia benthica]QGQ25614.1 hypothetical protein F1728_24305 [Gimesia benthica]
MHYVTGVPVLSGDIIWQLGENHFDGEDGICVSFSLHSFREQYQRRQAFRAIERILTENNVEWIIPDRENWRIDVLKLYEAFPDLPKFAWLSGTVAVVPEFEQTERDSFGTPSFDAAIRLYLTERELVHMPPHFQEPVEINDSIRRFRKDHPKPENVAFLMMRFGNTQAHDDIVTGIRDVFSGHGISVLRADDKQYHDDLLPNILTYIYGSSFGIAVFERLEGDDFNPNVSLEVGYMFALKKPVCLVKDQTLKTLHTDLVGKLYRPFDPQNAKESIKSPIEQWATDKGIITG